MSFTDRLAAAVLAAVLAVLRGLPDRWRTAIGGILAVAVYRLNLRLRQRAEGNLARVMPDIARRTRRRIALSMAGNVGRTLAEIMAMPQLLARAPEFAVGGPGLATIELAVRSGTGAIIVSGHFGQWEAVRAVLLHKGIQCGAIYRAFNNGAFDAAFRPMIEQAGRPILTKGRPGMRALVRHLSAGGIAAILADQRMPGPVLDFLGQPAQTPLAAAELALRFGLPLVPAYGTRHSDGYTLSVEFEAPIPHSDAAQMMQAVNDSLAARARRHPEQYLWLHWRWGKPGRYAVPPHMPDGAPGANNTDLKQSNVRKD
jgi:KDO2-lipid IV(A) lauroyltransferase